MLLSFYLRPIEKKAIWAYSRIIHEWKETKLHNLGNTNDQPIFYKYT